MAAAPTLASSSHDAEVIIPRSSRRSRPNCLSPLLLSQGEVPRPREARDCCRGRLVLLPPRHRPLPRSGHPRVVPAPPDHAKVQHPGARLLRKGPCSAAWAGALSCVFLLHLLLQCELSYVCSLTDPLCYTAIQSCLLPCLCAPCALHQHSVFLAEQRSW